MWYLLRLAVRERIAVVPLDRKSRKIKTWSHRSRSWPRITFVPFIQDAQQEKLLQIFGRIKTLFDNLQTFNSTGRSLGFYFRAQLVHGILQLTLGVLNNNYLPRVRPCSWLQKFCYPVAVSKFCPRFCQKCWKLCSSATHALVHKYHWFMIGCYFFYFLFFDKRHAKLVIFRRGSNINSLSRDHISIKCRFRYLLMTSF